MTGEDWAAVILDGLLSAVIGLVGVVIALGVTRRHERQHAVRARRTDALIDAATLTYTRPDGAPDEVLAWIRRLTADVMRWSMLADKKLEYHVAWGNTVTSFLMQAYVADTQAYTSATQLFATEAQSFISGASATPPSRSVPRPHWARVAHVAEQIKYGIEELVEDKPNQEVLAALLTNAHQSHWPSDQPTPAP